MRLGGLRRSRSAVLGLLAVLAILLQPVCGAYATAHGLDEDMQCCAEMQADAAVAAPSVNAPSVAVLSSLPVSAPYPDGPSTPVHSFQLTAWNHPPPPPPPLPYYVRSARIQR